MQIHGAFSTYTNWWAGFLNDQTVAWGPDFCLDGGSASSWYWLDSVRILVYPNDIDSSMLNLCFFHGCETSTGGIFLLRNIVVLPKHLSDVQTNQAFLVALGLNGWKWCGLQNLKTNWLVVSTHLKDISQIGSFPQIGMKIKNLWNHHLANQLPHTSKLPSFPRATSPFTPMPTQPSRKVQNKFFRGVDWKTTAMCYYRYWLCVRFQANILSYSAWALHQIQ